MQINNIAFVLAEDKVDAFLEQAKSSNAYEMLMERYRANVKSKTEQWQSAEKAPGKI